MIVNPFDTLLPESDELSPADSEKLIRELFQRQRAIEGLLRGEVDASYVLDMLQTHEEVNADDYVAEVCEGVELLIYE